MKTINIAAASLLSLILFAASQADAGTYMVFDDWGGTFADAEKTSSNTEDDDMCWAASSSNILEWTGWGLVSGMTTTDDMFGYFQDHWTDQGGNPYYGWDWWFDGTDNTQGSAGWSQVDVAGGGFWPNENINDYRRFSTSDATAMATIDSWLHDGYGTTISIGGPGAHSISVWGFDTDAQGNYSAVYVTDSDDSKNGSGTRPDLLQKYGVELSSGAWHLKSYFGTDAWYITEVVSLAKMPAVPLPSAAFMGLGLLGALGLYRRRRRI